MKSRKKVFFIVAVIGMLVIGGIVNASTQESIAELKSGSSSAKGNNINGGKAEVGGGLVEEGGKVHISVYEVVELWPDSVITSFFSDTVDTGATIDLKDLTYKNLYYVNIRQSKGSPHAKAKLTTRYVD